MLNVSESEQVMEEAKNKTLESKTESLSMKPFLPTKMYTEEKEKETKSIQRNTVNPIDQRHSVLFRNVLTYIEIRPLGTIPPTKIIYIHGNYHNSFKEDINEQTKKVTKFYKSKKYNQSKKNL